MKEYFIYAQSFAAPFFSDSSTDFVKAETPNEALEIFAKEYRHPTGLYSAGFFESSDDYHKGKSPIARWLCNHEIEKQKLTGDGSYSYRGNAPGDFEINGKRHIVEDSQRLKDRAEKRTVHTLATYGRLRTLVEIFKVASSMTHKERAQHNRVPRKMTEADLEKTLIKRLDLMGEIQFAEH